LKGGSIGNKRKKRAGSGFLGDFVQNIPQRVQIVKLLEFIIDDDQQPRTFSLLKGIYLMPASGDVWKSAFESQLSEQRMFDNVANVVANFFIRIVGWMFLEMLIYQGKHAIPTNDDP